MENKKYGNLEIILESLEANVTQEQLDELMNYITEKVESMGLTLAGRSYISTDEDYENAEEPEPTEER
jgi:hypothetical protein